MIKILNNITEEMSKITSFWACYSSRGGWTPWSCCWTWWGPFCPPWQCPPQSSEPWQLGRQSRGQTCPAVRIISCLVLFVLIWYDWVTVLVTSQICVLDTKVFILFIVLVPSSDILSTNIFTLFMVTTLVPNSNLLHSKVLTVLMVSIMVPCSDILDSNVFNLFIRTVLVPISDILHTKGAYFTHGDNSGAKLRNTRYLGLCIIHGDSLVPSSDLLHTKVITLLMVTILIF